MSEQVLIQFRIDRQLRDDVNLIFNAVGLDMTTALRMFLCKVSQTQGLHFNAVLNENFITKSDIVEIVDELRNHLADTSNISIDNVINSTEAYKKN